MPLRETRDVGEEATLVLQTKVPPGTALFSVTQCRRWYVTFEGGFGCAAMRSGVLLWCCIFVVCGLKWVLLIWW